MEIQKTVAMDLNYKNESYIWYRIYVFCPCILLKYITNWLNLEENGVIIFHVFCAFSQF